MPTKGITPIISIIILLLITVALAGASWTFIQGFLFPQITKAFIISPGAAFCTGGTVKVFVLNTGYRSELLTPSDWIIAEVEGIDITVGCPTQPTCGLTDAIIQTGDADRVVFWDCDLGDDIPSCNGTLRVSLGTSSTVQHFNVFCP